MEILGKLFGSEHKVKVMRLFLFNPETPFTAESVSERIRASLFSTREALGILLHMKLIKRRSFTARVTKRTKGRKEMSRRKVSAFVLNASFPYLSELQRLLLNKSLLKGEEIARRLASAGRLKLVIIAGLFIQNPESRLDILVVGDHLKKHRIQHKIQAMEAEIGKELRYAAFETREFNYRLGLYDKLVRDVLDYPHVVVFDRLGLPPIEIAPR